MKTSSQLPANLTIDIDKIAAYLLNPASKDGRSKAKYFLSHGFTIEAAEVLAQALFDHTLDATLKNVSETVYGQRFVFEGALKAPKGETGSVRTVWEVGPNEDVGRFVTAYPC